jgi:dimethylhistidine N-methyltransferase
MMLKPNVVTLNRPNETKLVTEIIQGLKAKSASLPPKLFYDALGSRLFDAITALPEYYPPRIEADLLKAQAQQIARLAGPKTVLIDLGAGNCEKAALLIPDMKPAHYVAVDIAVDHLGLSIQRLQHQFPELPMTALGTDFSEHLELSDSLPPGPRLFFYPGSSIGNFTPPKAALFLSEVRAQFGLQGSLVMGVDLVKDEAVLQRAYDDPLGVTAAFNKNILNHVNRLIQSDFSLAEFEHLAVFNASDYRIEMHLRAATRQTVQWPGGHRLFEAGETIHTENSYKYTLDSLRQMLTQAGFGAPQIWVDARQYFAVVWAK